MQVKQLKHDGLSYEIEVTVKARDIGQRRDQRLKELAKGMRIPGFRPGKAPLSLMVQRYGKSVMGEVLEQTVNETSLEALKKEGLRPAFQPKIEVKSFEEDKDLTYVMNLDVLPEFKVADFKGLKLEKLVAEVGDKEVQEALERLAANMQDSRPIEGKRAAKTGDILLMDFHGRTADDNVAHPGMHAHGHKLELGSGQFIPGFEEQLVGQKAGEKVEVKVTFPEEYGAEELAGRAAIFDVDIHEIHEKTDVKIDDAMAQKLGLESLEALKNAAKSELEKEYGQHSAMKIKRALLDHLDAAHDFEIPPNMLEMEYQGIIDQIEHNIKTHGSEAKITDAEKEDYRAIAERRVRLGLVLAEIGHENKLQVSDQDLQRAVIHEAQKYPGQEKEVFDYYSKNRQALESLRAPLFEDKVVNFILEQAAIQEKKVSPEELTADDEEFESPKNKKKAPAKKSGTKKAPAEKAEPQKEGAKKKAPAKKAPAKKKTES